MHAGLLDMLHHAANQHIFTIADGIHIDFPGVIQKAVKKDRRVV